MSEAKSSWFTLVATVVVVLLALLWFTFYGDEGPGPHVVGDPLP